MHIHIYFFRLFSIVGYYMILFLFFFFFFFFFFLLDGLGLDLTLFK